MSPSAIQRAIDAAKKAVDKATARLDRFVVALKKKTGKGRVGYSKTRD